MCGRFALFTPAPKLAEIFQAELHFNYDASYNLAPTLPIAVLITIGEERHIVPMRWGLIPTWHREGEKLSVLNNAKLETIDTKPSFRHAFTRHRCLILADGFYEWDAHTQPKQPYYFHRSDHQPIALAGIWERWTSGSTPIESCCIITEPANALVATVHTRMPAIITSSDYDQWLDPTIDDTKLAKSLAQSPNAYNGIDSYPVTPKMNRVVFNNVQCIQKI